MAVGTGRVRISKATNLERFIARAKAACPVDVLVIVAIQCHPLAHCWINLLLAEHKSHGQWFELSPEVEALIEVIVSDGLDGLREYLKAHDYRLP